MDTLKKVPKVAVIQRIFPIYRSIIFKTLGEERNARIFHGEDNSGIPQITNGYSEKFRLLKFMGFSYLSTTFRILRYSPSVVVQEFSLSFVNLYTNYVIARISKKKFILWGHGYARAQGFSPELRVSDKIRQYFIRRADGIILYSEAVARELSGRYPQKRFFVATNSIDSPERNEIYSRLMRDGRDKVKHELRFQPILNICFVARLTASKKPHLLSDLAGSFEKSGRKVMIHVVGDGELLSDLKDTVSLRQQDSSFRFYGAVYDEEVISKIIYASDFMIIPAWLGLSINHSLCYGTPVASLKNESHPPEIEFAEDNMNAILGSCTDEIVERICDVWHDSYRYSAMRSYARSYYERKLSLSSMLSGFSNAIDGVFLR